MGVYGMVMGFLPGSISTMPAHLGGLAAGLDWRTFRARRCTARGPASASGRPSPSRASLVAIYSFWIVFTEFTRYQAVIAAAGRSA